MHYKNKFSDKKKRKGEEIFQIKGHQRDMTTKYKNRLGPVPEGSFIGRGKCYKQLLAWLTHVDELWTTHCIVSM